MKTPPPPALAAIRRTIRFMCRTIFYLSRATLPASVLALLLANAIHAAEPGETLYNGIVLPRPWPPRLADFPTSVETDPITPPYLISPPAVIPIDIGRQLFVDDFLIAETTL